MVLHGLECCGLDPMWREDCKDCPYLCDPEDEPGCYARLARDARAVILRLDALVDSMDAEKRGTGGAGRDL